MIYFCVLLAGILLWLVYEWAEHTAVEYKSTEVESQKLKPGEALKVCLITDLHNNKKNLQKITEHVQSFSPDMVLLAGDMVDKHKKKNEQAIHLIRALSKTAPVYYSFGNHEEALRQEKQADWQAYLASLPKEVILLDNETVSAKFPGIQTQIFISGLSLPESFYKKGRLSDKREELPELSGHRLPEALHILLAHNPEYAPWYEKYAPDFVVSGHLHGGLLRLPLVGGVISPRLRIPGEDAGLYPYPYGSLFISRGLGSHTIPLRFFNRVEINHITLYGK